MPKAFQRVKRKKKQTESRSISRREAEMPGLVLENRKRSVEKPKMPVLCAVLRNRRMLKIDTRDRK